MRDAAAAVRTEMADIVEPLTIQSVASEEARKELAAKLKGASKRIKDATEPSVGRKIRIAFASLADPDDLIQCKVNLFVATDQALGSTVGPAIAEAVPEDSGVAGALAPRTYQQKFSGDGARYYIDYAVE